MKSLSNLSTAIGWLLLLAALYVAIRPGGVLRTRAEHWERVRVSRKLAGQEWPELSHGETSLGHPSSGASVVEFVDYLCHYCRAFDDSLALFLRTHSTVAVTVRFRPVYPESVSRTAALAAICAAKTGTFADMHRYLMTDTTWMADPDWTSVAEAGGVVNVVEWRACLASKRAKLRLTDDSLWANRLAIHGTPSFVTEVAGTHSGIVSLAVFGDWVSRAAAARN